MRILVLNWLDRQNPEAGGAEAHLHETFGRLAGRGHEVTLLASGFPGAPTRDRVDGIEVHRVGRRFSYPVAAFGYFRRELAHLPFDVVVEDLNKVPLFSPLWARAPVVLLVHHLFGGIAFQEASLPLATATWLLERPVPRAFRSSPIVAVSWSTADDLIRRGLPRENIEIIPNGVDVEWYRPLPAGRRFPEPTLLFLGRLKRYKRVDLPIRATAALAEKGTGARLLVAGKGDDRGRLVSLVRRLGIEDRVEFLGFVSEEEKLELLQRSWVHLFTSPKEGWGIANLEAAACGTPTVASDSPGLRDSVRDAETGYLVPHGDVDALAGRIGQLLSDSDLRKELGSRARRFAEEFSWERTAVAMERFLSRRVANSAATG